MEIQEIISVSDARTQLSQILGTLALEGPTAAPVVIGAHRKPQGVLMSIALYEELTGARRRAGAASATGSVRAEGLQPSAASDADTDEYVRGSIDADELVARAVARHRVGQP
ncbi:type II toxin-antitoxin system Phd/YefM family antitoxin [Kitasatospora sp. NPDC101801]|uniref:antitoxin VbhA family protein n=1 Tax=Kitasatospora sp. NPDC101801 TaxID=3364103 RepID=UPI00380C4ABD